MTTYDRVAAILARLDSHIDDNPPPGSQDYVQGLHDGVQAAINLTRGLAAGIRRDRRP